MFYATVTVPNGTTFYLGRKSWSATRDHRDVIRFETKADAYRAYQKAYKRRDDVYRAIPTDGLVAT